MGCPYNSVQTSSSSRELLTDTFRESLHLPYINSPWLATSCPYSVPASGSCSTLPLTIIKSRCPISADGEITLYLQSVLPPDGYGDNGAVAWEQEMNTGLSQVYVSGGGRYTHDRFIRPVFFQ